MWLGTAIAVTQLLVKGGRRLRHLLLDNPAAADRLLASLAPLVQRVEIMHALTSGSAATPAALGDAASTSAPEREAAAVEGSEAAAGPSAAGTPAVEDVADAVRVESASEAAGYLHWPKEETGVLDDALKAFCNDAT